jgi:diguanylate cyclase (GGDEF)-like protein
MAGGAGRAAAEKGNWKTHGSRMTTPLRVLIVEDSDADTELLLRQLRHADYDPAWERVETAEIMSAALDCQPWDIVIADYTMPQFRGIDALLLLQEKGLDIPFIMVSGTIGEDIAVAAMKAGAHDYIMKNNTARLVPAIERELKEAEVRRHYRRMQERVQYLAYYDPLTDLPNRALFTDRLEQAVLLGHREKHCFALMLMDLDRFKSINDTLGHHAGDRALQQVAARLKTCLRESDTVARMGGDEFAILLPTASHKDGAVVVARKILAAIAESFQIEDRHFQIGISLGIALFPEHGAESDFLMRAADAAMYEAKNPRNDFRVYNPPPDSRYANS